MMVASPNLSISVALLQNQMGSISLCNNQESSTFYKISIVWTYHIVGLICVYASYAVRIHPWQQKFPGILYLRFACKSSYTCSHQMQNNINIFNNLNAVHKHQDNLFCSRVVGWDPSSILQFPAMQNAFEIPGGHCVSSVNSVEEHLVLVSVKLKHLQYSAKSL